MPIAREGYPFILTPLVIGLVMSGIGYSVLAYFLGAVGLFTLWFFRDPERKIPTAGNAVTSPADGKIVEIAGEPDSLSSGQGEMARISIFMSVFNVHVNRFPIPGQVVESIHKPGKFGIASKHGAGMQNERLITSAHMENGSKFFIVQVAGFVARRIVSYAKPGDLFEKGERFGMIRFGSRVDLYLPADTEIIQGVGDKVLAGVTVLGYLNGEK